MTPPTEETVQAKKVAQYDLSAASQNGFAGAEGNQGEDLAWRAVAYRGVILECRQPEPGQPDTGATQPRLRYVGYIRVGVVPGALSGRILFPSGGDKDILARNLPLFHLRLEYLTSGANQVVHLTIHLISGQHRRSPQLPT